MLVFIGILIGLLLGGIAGALAVGALGKSRLGAARQQSKHLVDEAQREADTLRREAQITAREEAVRLRADIDQEVTRMQLGRLNAFMTKSTLRVLRRRAYSRAQFERLAAASAFRTCDIQTEGIGLEVRLTKRGAA